MSEGDSLRRDGANEPGDDASVPQETTTGWMPWGMGWGWGAGYLPWYPRNTDPDEVASPPEDTATGGSWWGESLSSILLITGLVLFIFPEPATSALGVILMLAGAFGWIVSELL